MSRGVTVVSAHWRLDVVAVRWDQGACPSEALPNGDLLFKVIRDDELESDYNLPPCTRLHGTSAVHVRSPKLTLMPTHLAILSFTERFAINGTHLPSFRCVIKSRS